MKGHFMSVAILALTLTPMGRVSAEIIYESGTSGGGPGGTNYVAGGGNLVGVRFEVTQSDVTDAIGGVFGFGDLFGAVVQLSGPSDFPDSTNLSTPDVLGTAVIHPAGPADSSSPLSLALSPGWYALVYGSGQFGASGIGFVPNTATDVGSPSYLFYTNGNAGFSNDSISHVRLFVTGHPASQPGGPVIPEPGSLVLWGVSGPVFSSSSPPGASAAPSPSSAR